jgi:hypothetical protein
VTGAIASFFTSAVGFSNKKLYEVNVNFKYNDIYNKIKKILFKKPS